MRKNSNVLRHLSVDATKEEPEKAGVVRRESRKRPFESVGKTEVQRKWRTLSLERIARVRDDGVDEGRREMMFTRVWFESGMGMRGRE